MLTGRSLRASRPVRLSTEVVRLGREEPAPAMFSSSDCLLLRQRRNAAKARAARPTRTPMTIPAIAPPDMPRCIGEVAGESLPGMMIGVVVTVWVTTDPDLVMTDVRTTWVREADELLGGGDDEAGSAGALDEYGATDEDGGA